MMQNCISGREWSVAEVGTACAIEMRKVSKQFKGTLGAEKVQAISNIDLLVKQGEVFGFLGPNGAGKSTTIKVLMNLIFPDSGEAFIKNQDVRNHHIRKSVGYLPENPFFYDYLSADELLWFGGRASGMLLPEIEKARESLLERVGLQQARKRQLRSYSKGMVQRAGLALALIHNPGVVILDEPMSGLDPLGRKMVGDLILDMKREGKTVFFSSHILADIERFCDRIGIIVGGQIRLVGAVRDVVPSGGSLEELFLRVVSESGGGNL